MESLLSTKQLAPILGVSPYTITGWVHRKKIPFIKVGGLTRFRLSAIERWISKNTKQTK